MSCDLIRKEAGTSESELQQENPIFFDQTNRINEFHSRRFDFLSMYLKNAINKFDSAVII